MTDRLERHARAVRHSALALALATLAAGQGDASAQTAEQVYRRAIEQFATADFQGSVASLERALALTRDAELIGQIHLYLGANFSALGQPGRARRSFHQALVHAPELDLDPARFKVATVQLFRSVRSGMRGTLQVSAGPQQGRVFVDGRPVGSTPCRVRLPVGRHVVEARGSDGVTWQRSAVVVGHGQLTMVEARSHGETRTAPSVDVPSPRPRRRLWTWVAAGGAVVSLGAAVGLVLSGWSDNKSYQDAPDEASASKFEESGKPKQRAGQVLFGVAGALAVTSVVLYLLEGRDDRADRSARLAPLLGRGAGLSLDLTF